MTLVLNATPSDPAANSYATVAQAVAYAEGRLNTDDFIGLSVAEQERALVDATMRIDQWDYDGTASTSTQALKWPRLGLSTADGYDVDGTVIPVFVRYACIEEAMAGLRDPSGADASGLGQFKQVQIGPIHVEPAASEARSGLCKAASRYLARYRIGGTQARIVRA